MKWPKKCYLLILAATIVAIALRLPRLEQRPMHVDEAVNAVKFGELLEEGDYRYDPHEYHGPTLNYFTLLPAWLSGVQKYADLSEFTLRIVPVFFRGAAGIAAFAAGRWLGMDHSGLYRRPDRCLTGICLLQSLLHSRNVTGLFHLCSNRLRLALYSEQKHQMGFTDWDILGPYARNQGNMYHCFRFNAVGSFAYALAAAPTGEYFKYH